MPDLSVIIPTYNSEAYLGVPLASLKGQTGGDFEVLVCDDGSEDDTISVAFSSLEAAAFPGQVFPMDHKGVSAVRNAGLLHASGQYVCFLDSDDSFMPDFVVKMTQNTRGVDAVFCAWVEISPSGKKRRGPEQARIVAGPDLALMFLERKVDLCISAALFGMDIMRAANIRFHERCRFGEDREFIVQFLLNCKSVKLMPDELFRYNIRKGSVSNTENRSVYTAHLSIPATYFRIRKTCQRKGLNEIRHVVENYCIPIEYVKRLRTYLRIGRESLFLHALAKRSVRGLLRKAVRTALARDPEYAIKAAMFLFLPSMARRKYSSRIK